MTNYQIKLFSNLVDLNWEMNNSDYNQTVKNALMAQYFNVMEMLKEDMGAAEFREYIRMGREMFTPADGGYGDESPEEVARMMEAVR